jgi:hypothetical protein
MSNRNSQLSVQVNDQLKLCALVEASAAELAEKIHLGFVELLTPVVGDGEPPPDLRTLQLQLARWLAQRRQTMEELDASFARDLRWEQRLRQQRDDATKVLVSRLRLVQAQLDHAVGKGRSGIFAGFATGLSLVDPALLTRIAEQAVEELRTVHFGRKELSGLDLTALAASIEEPLAALKAALLELTPSLRRTQIAREAKQAHLAALSRDVRRGVAFLGGCYRFTGLDFHAERLRPKPRTGGVAEEEEGEGSTPTPAAANDVTPVATPTVAEVAT